MAALASQVKSFFPNLWFGLLVGVAAGLPNLTIDPPLDIRLGDVFIAVSNGDNSGLVAYELGQEEEDHRLQLLHRGQVLANIEAAVLSAIRSIKLRMRNDPQLFLRHYNKVKNEEHKYETFYNPGQKFDTFYKFN